MKASRNKRSGRAILINANLFKKTKVVVTQRFFIFTHTWGNDPIWQAYFSNGLKPPTRKKPIALWIPLAIVFFFEHCFLTTTEFGRRSDNSYSHQIQCRSKKSKWNPKGPQRWFEWKFLHIKKQMTKHDTVSSWVLRRHDWLRLPRSFSISFKLGMSENWQ